MVKKGGVIKLAQVKLGVYLAGGQDNADQEGQPLGDGIGYIRGIRMGGWR